MEAVYQDKREGKDSEGLSFLSNRYGPAHMYMYVITTIVRGDIVQSMHINADVRCVWGYVTVL